MPQLSRSAPYLVTKMTGEQYLDAISCPRLDPIVQGKQVAASLNGQCVPPGFSIPAYDRRRNNDSDESDDGTSGDIENRSDDEGSLQETLPSGLECPNARLERLIERVCRMICLSKADNTSNLERQFLEQFGRDTRYSFLNPSNEHHEYYLWRLDRNKAGCGIKPQYDYAHSSRQ